MHTCFLCNPRNFCVLLMPFFMQCARFAMSTLCTLGHHLAHCAHCAHYCFSHCFLFFSETRWFRRGSNKLLLASWRSDEIRRRDIAVADGLLSCLWRRAEKAIKMTHRLTGAGDSTRYQNVSAVFVRVNLCWEFCILKTI